MKLAKLKEKISQRQNLSDRSQLPPKYQLGRPAPELAPGLNLKEANSRIYLWLKARFVYVVAVLAAILIILSAYVYFQFAVAFDQSKVVLEISGPDQVMAGETNDWQIKIRNNSQVSLDKGVLTVDYSQGASWPQEQAEEFQLASIGPGQIYEHNLPIAFLSAKDSLEKTKLIFNFKPANSSSFFSRQAFLTAKVFSVPLRLNLQVPANIVSGADLSIQVEIENEADYDLADLVLKMDYPAGFNAQDFSLEPNPEKNMWLIDNLAPEQTMSLAIKGSLQGGEQELKVFQIFLGRQKDNKFISLLEESAGISISLPDIFLSQLINGKNIDNLDLGAEVVYQVNFVNTTAEALSQLVLVSYLEGQAFDLNSVKPGAASFNKQAGSLTWDWHALDELKELAPGQEKNFSFSVRLQSSVRQVSYSDKNFSVAVDSQLRAVSAVSGLLQTQSRLEAKINSQISFSAKAYYYDSSFDNSGPLPPQAGQATNYSLYWQIINGGNDLSEVEVRAGLPPYVFWQNNVLPRTQPVFYDAIKKEVVWRIDYLPAGTGIISPVRQVGFQIGLEPVYSQVGQIVDLILASELTAQDNYTGEQLYASSPGLDSSLPDDGKVDQAMGRVK